MKAKWWFKIKTTQSKNVEIVVEFHVNASFVSIDRGKLPSFICQFFVEFLRRFVQKHSVVFPAKFGNRRYLCENVFSTFFVSHKRLSQEVVFEQWNYAKPDFSVLLCSRCWWTLKEPRSLDCDRGILKRKKKTRIKECKSYARRVWR